MLQYKHTYNICDTYISALYTLYNVHSVIGSNLHSLSMALCQVVSVKKSLASWQKARLLTTSIVSTCSTLLFAD
jgi:hypothetical protein